MNGGIVEIFESSLNEVLKDACTLFDDWEDMPRSARSPLVMSILSRVGELTNDCEEVVRYIENSFPPIRLTADENWRKRIKEVRDIIKGLQQTQGNTDDIKTVLDKLAVDNQTSERILMAYDKSVDMEKIMLETLTAVFSHLHDLLATLRATLDSDRTIVYAQLYATAEARYAKEAWRKDETKGEWYKFMQHVRNTKFPWGIEPTFEQLLKWYQEDSETFVKTKVGTVWCEHTFDHVELGVAIAENNFTTEELDEFFRQKYRLQEIKHLADIKHAGKNIFRDTLLVKGQDNDTFFIDDLDLQKLKSGISVMWSKEMPQNYLAAISGKLLNNQNEWWVFYALFDKLKWYKKKPTQKEFCDFMTEWFKGEEYEHVKPCTVYDFKKLDNYIKKTKCDKWDIDAESYRGQRHKLKEFIFIFTELEREFTNKKYFIL